MAKNPPEGWSTLASAVFYDDAGAAIDWLSRVIGFETRLRIDGDGGDVLHSELVFGDGVVMVASPKRPPFKSPRSLGGASTQSILLYVPDVDAHHARARKAGAKVVTELESKHYGDDYGTNRSYELEDPEGHRWWITQRL
jgi:uncharacterized glyoxalase superfamily protein PhnB